MLFFKKTTVLILCFEYYCFSLNLYIVSNLACTLSFCCQNMHNMLKHALCGMQCITCLTVHGPLSRAELLTQQCTQRKEGCLSHLTPHLESQRKKKRSIFFTRFNTGFQTSQCISAHGSANRHCLTHNRAFLHRTRPNMRKIIYFFLIFLLFLLRGLWSASQFKRHRRRFIFKSAAISI